MELTNDQAERLVTAFERIGQELENLGNAGAVTTEGGLRLGAIEGLAMVLRDGLGQIAAAVEHLSERD